MKKLIYLYLFLLSVLTSCSLLEIDNYEPYNASISGVFKDAKTGSNVGQETIYNNLFGGNISSRTSGYISVFETGWDYEKAQFWLVKYDGSYNNTQVFAGTYRLEAKQNNFYPEVKENITLNKGSNTLDWTVTPYVRIIDPVIVFDASVNKFKATFKLEYGDASKANSIFMARLCCYPDQFVGIALNNCQNDPGASASVGIVANGTTVNTLYIDPQITANASQFKYSPRTHYFRIAVCAVGTGHNTSRIYNYSPTVSIKY